MDRDKRWDRVRKAYDLFVSGRGELMPNSSDTIQRSYANDVGDEFVEPVVIGAADQGRLEEGDGLLCFGLRALVQHLA